MLSLYVCLSVCLSLSFSLSLSGSLSACLSVCPSVGLSVSLFLSPSVRHTVFLPVCLSVPSLPRSNISLPELPHRLFNLFRRAPMYLDTSSFLQPHTIHS